MCGRYSLYSSEKVLQKFGVTISPNYNITPGKKVILLDNKLSLIYMRWGLNFKWLKNNMIINARLESLNNKNFYSDYKRCIFIADGYIEWKKDKNKKTPYFHCINNNLIYMAGLYKDCNAVIITINSGKRISHIHI